MRFVEIVVLGDLGDQAFEVVELRGKPARAISAREEIEIVVKPQLHAGKDDLGADLRRDV